jgi:hypothetical protein
MEGREAMAKATAPTTTTRRAVKIDRLAEELDCHRHTIFRAVSHGMIKVIYVGNDPRVPPDEADRVRREGLPNIPPGYKRKTTGPGGPGRPKKKSVKSAPPAKARRGEARPAA